ncbi:hypothetical protein B0187_02725 [Haemophilus paracuniculus]|uniref:Uncharacterized protein n=1 Tax=Haemophilus paracuniculus TaxID=734 RepID=A0A1T0ASW3_9PAST|nr:hypothetical protein [Haemophilus paracuniculus]OOR99739.1 hypothetical protein B0187_02725 [Haemophilus paracuniculus]
MKKYIKTVVSAFVLVNLVGCSSEPKVIYREPVVEKPKIEWTMQPIEDSVLLNPGMSEQETANILGRPIVKEFEGQGSALQWCKTGMGGTPFPYDRYLIGFFYNGKLVGTRNYARTEHKYGDCSTLYREIEWKPSDTVIEYRFKN